MKRFLVAAVVLVGNIAVHAAYNWNNVQIWGGGYVPGVAFHPTEEGLTYIRTDVGGAYRLESDKRTWRPLNDMFDNSNDMGSIAIGLDPGNPNTVYVTGGLYLPVSWCGSASVFKSVDKGISWTQLPLNNQTVTGTSAAVLNDKNSLCLGGNAGNRGTGNRLAVRDDIVYLGTDQNGLLMSENGGSGWTTAAQFSNTGGISAVQFDKDGNIYAAPFAGGLYRSSNGTQWTQVSGFTGVVYQMSYDGGNTIWFTTNTGRPADHSEVSGGSVYKYAVSTGTLTQITTLPAKGDKNYGYIGISVNPNDTDQILVSTGGWWNGTGSSPLDGNAFKSHEAVFMSTDGGQSWKDIIAGGRFDIAEAYNAASSNPHWISALAVNPHDRDHVIFGTGYGVWSTFNATAATPVWYFTNRGIEETKPLGLVSTKYGAPLVSVLGDIDGFYHSDLNTPQLSRHKVENGVNEAGTNFDIDYAGQRQNYMVRIHKAVNYKLGAYSTDGGKTWKDFGSNPPFVLNEWGSPGEDNFVAVSADASAIVWNMAAHGVYYSTDNGATWTRSSTTTGLAGFRPVADRVTAGTFYLYNSATGTLYRSTNNGAGWTPVNTNLATEGGDWARWAFRLYASPDQAGELWITQGITSFSNLWLGGTGGIRRSVDGGTTFIPVSGAPAYVRSIGFGKGSAPGSLSAIYAVGKQNNAQLLSVFRSDNSGGAWTRINSDANSFGEITMVTGDPCIYSRVYLGTEGRGIIYGTDPSLAEACDCPDRIDNPNTPVNYRKPASSIKKPTLIRQGKFLRSSAPIRLYTLTGKVIAASSSGSEGVVTLNMARVPNGMYIAKSGTQSLRVSLQK
ncbi:MAG: hypothetical protein LBI42_00660 [Chitinispirillales bacterium]|jgi:hypothetical protein|nr:hypothetical protein [Chitinispirillales bacterium]